jgi:hypothetical protein
MKRVAAIAVTRLDHALYFSSVKVSVQTDAAMSLDPFFLRKVKVVRKM